MMSLLTLVYRLSQQAVVDNDTFQIFQSKKGYTLFLVCVNHNTHTHTHIDIRAQCVTIINLVYLTGLVYNECNLYICLLIQRVTSNNNNGNANNNNKRSGIPYMRALWATLESKGYRIRRNKPCKGHGRTSDVHSMMIVWMGVHSYFS